MVSLGCAKNLVDAEIMLGSVLQRGMEITSSADEADVLIVNTCAFIDSAKEESIDAILTAHQARGLNKRAGQKLIVSGCMSQRFARELREEMPEVDAFIGLDEVKQLGAIVERVLAKKDVDLAFAETRPTYVPDYDTPRFRLTPAHSVYVKIAEGCNHPCSFCVIPQMRGKHRSRTMESVLVEIRGLVAEGVREIQEIDGDFWVRLLYTHPAHWSDELIETIADCNKVACYIDIPLQHIHESMLQRMRRETSRSHIENLIGKLRTGIPGLALRTTFIVGFPGETDEEFESLLEFIARVRFERLGIFKYSREEGSRAAKMPGQVPVKLKNARYREAMSIQQTIAHEMARENIGRQLKLLVDQPLIARTEADAPEVDTRVILAQPAPVGEFVVKRISGARGYDLLA